MNRQLPPLDLHCHISPRVKASSLEALGAVTFAATRSIDEFEQVRGRHDSVTIWGVGCHPRVTSAQSRFDVDQFSELLAGTPFVSEVGLDGASVVPMARQRDVLGSILSSAEQAPRILSIHSHRATDEVLNSLEANSCKGMVLHWWLGNAEQTRRAVALGCRFSVNRRMRIGSLQSAGVPLSLILPETDHPGGNPGTKLPQQPGWTLDVERSVGAVYGIDPAEVRSWFWKTLVQLVDETQVEGLFPVAVQRMLAYAREV